MKILFVIDTLQGGGMQRRFLQLLKLILKDPKYSIELFVMDSEIHFKELDNLDIKVKYLLRKTKRDPSIFQRLYKIVKEIDPSIIHAWGAMPVFYSIPASILLRKKLVNSQIADAFLKRSFFINLISKINFFFSDKIIANSYAGLTAYNIKTKKGICIHNGFDFNRIKNEYKVLNLKDQYNITTKYIVGMIANYSHYKDYRTYILAAISICKRRNDITFFGIGQDMGTKDEMLKLVKINSSYNIQLLDRVNNVEDYIKLFDVCVLSTYTEGISNSILEYMALEKPVIATKGGGTSELVIDRETGYLIQPSNPKILEERILELIENDELRSKLGKNGKSRVKEFFSIESMYNNYTSCYRELFEDK